MERKVKLSNLSSLKKVKKEGLTKIFPGKPRIAVGYASCGIAAGADTVLTALQKEIKKRKLDISLTKVGCIGYCTVEPVVNLSMPDLPMVVYHDVAADDVKGIIDRLVEGDVYREKALCKIEKWDHITKGNNLGYGKGFSDIMPYSEVGFFGKQKKIILRNAGLINPEDIEEYIAVGGFSALVKALRSMTPEQVIDEVAKSGLRGRGGAGFPTGRKWKFARDAEGDKKYVICNADEGDPGAYMNRNEMESDPCMVIEGMIIGAYAIGANDGLIYIREEYPLAIKRLQNAIKQAREYGLLGKNILNSGFDFDINIVKGAGAFVCGEETALIASIEGFAGRARPRPPFPAEKGLYGKPTNINNVETWSSIPVIISLGGDWFSQTGTEGNKGTKVLSLVGKISQSGLVEIPLGTSLKTILYDIGGGGLGGKKIKAVQTGGPSGGCIPASHFDASVDFESLTKLGSIMGSGGMVVMDEDTCMVDTARYFIDFTRDESCGKCAPCREGLKHMLEILTDINEGKGTMEELAMLEELAELVRKQSLCGLGQTAPNPVFTTLRYFRDEYKAHIEQNKCPAFVCKELVSYYIDPAKCQACGTCLRNCPVGAIDGDKGKIHVINQRKCVKCNTCFEMCPPRFSAVTKISGESVPRPPSKKQRAIVREKNLDKA
jgi:NADH:ubiquinone oxidoreductase subunit F (NADH-binding)/(2Fe-2S) ferredoxin